MPSPRLTFAALAALALTAACDSPAAPRPLATGTFVAPAPGWAGHHPPQAGLQVATRRSALTHRVGEVLILEGDAATVSGVEGQWGLRLDEARNDVAAVTRRVAEDGADAEAILVLFTTFDDLGSGGPAYYVPFFSDVAGLGLDPLDQRSTFGVSALLGIANMKRRESHRPDTRLPLLAHEIAHRHLAYLEAAVAGSTVAVPLLGRQDAHWHAALNTDGSVLGGHGFTEIAPGEFVVSLREVTFSSLDLYGLGLYAPSEVEAQFFVEDARTLDGFAIPAEARLDVGAQVRGVRRSFSIDDVVSTLGPRVPASSAPESRLVFALLTAPGEAATSSAAVREAEAVDALRAALVDAWPGLTRGRGTLCTALEGCAPPAQDGGVEDGVDAGSGGDAGFVAPEDSGCRATGRDRVGLWCLVAVLLRRRRRK